MLLDDLYAGGTWLRRWHIDGRGQPACWAPVKIADAHPDDVAAILAFNSEVREVVYAVEAYEAAVRVATLVEPEPRTEIIVNPLTEVEEERVTEAWVRWRDAQDLVDTADDEVIWLAAFRADPPSEPEEVEDDFVARPPPEPVPAIISDRQFFQHLAKAGVISVSEGLAAVKIGKLPLVMADILSLIPEKEIRDDVEFNLSGSTTFERAHPYTQMLASLFGWGASQLDAVFIEAAKL